jgi:YfiH family protein
MIRSPRGSLVAYEFASLRVQPSLVHAVFARHGGVSPQPWRSLNLSITTGDTPENVTENYRRVYGALGYTPHAAVTSRQVHGNHVVVVDGAQRGQCVPDCDALITRTPHTVLLQRHADCPPVFVYDPRRRAIGVAHAGWRGTLANIAGVMVKAMQDAFDTKPSELIAGIGPGIGACCYHIGAEVQQAFIARHAQGRAWLQECNGKAYLDLWEANRAMLAAAGVREIEVAGICTSCQAQDFYSARAERRQNGCFGAAIALMA